MTTTTTTEVHDVAPRDAGSRSRTAPAPGDRSPRVLFVSVHSLLDSTNGAAHSMRDILALSARAGAVCASLTAAGFDDPTATAASSALRGALEQSRLPWIHANASTSAGCVDVFGYDDRGVRSWAAALGERGARDLDATAGPLFLGLYERILDRFRPDVVITYGGGRAGRAISAATRRRGIPIAYRVSNYAYGHADLFDGCASVLTPSAHTARHYERTLGLKCTPIPSPLDWSRVQVGAERRRFLTFVGATASKGIAVASRIFSELAERRPEIPVLVIVGRGKLASLGEFGIDPARHPNVHVMGRASDVRVVHGLTRLLLVPSLVESSARIAQEAIVNGIPTIGSASGGIPETLREAGIVLPVPDAESPLARRVPSAEEVEPWLRRILELWDDRSAYAREVARCEQARSAIAPDLLGQRYKEHFAALSRDAASRAGARSAARSMPFVVGSLAGSARWDAALDEIGRGLDTTIARATGAGDEPPALPDFAASPVLSLREALAA